MKHYKITAWAMVLAAACMTGCSEKQLSDIPYLSACDKNSYPLLSESKVHFRHSTSYQSHK